MPLKDLLNNFSQKVQVKNRNNFENERLKKISNVDEQDKPIVPRNRIITRAKAKELKNGNPVAFRGQRSSLNLERPKGSAAAGVAPKRNTMIEHVSRNSVACKRKLNGSRKEQGSFKVTPFVAAVDRRNHSKIPKLSKCFEDAPVRDNYPTPELLTVSMLATEVEQDPQYCEDYVEHIFKYMMDLEIQRILAPDFLETNPSINAHARGVLINWLNLVQSHENILLETFLMCVSMIDSCLAAQTIPMEMLQLLGVTCLLVATKYEERFPLPVARLTFFTANSCNYNDIITMETNVLRTIDFRVFSPTPVHYTRWFVKQLTNIHADIDAIKLEHISLYLITSLTTDVRYSCERSSREAAACILLGMLILARRQGTEVAINSRLVFGEAEFAVEDLVPVMHMVVDNFDEERVKEFPGAKDLFSHRDYGEISCKISKEDIVDALHALKTGAA